MSRSPRPADGSGATWHEVDLLQPGAARALVERVRPTHLLHLAWFVVPGKLIAAPENFDWVAASLELVRGFADAGGTRLCVCGSGYEYDWTHGYCTEGLTPCVPDTVYGACKHALHEMVRDLRRRTRPERCLAQGLLPLRPEGTPRAAGLIGDSLAAARGARALLAWAPGPRLPACSGRGGRPGGGAGLGGSGCDQRELGASHDAAGDRVHHRTAHWAARAGPPRRDPRPRQ